MPETIVLVEEFPMLPIGQDEDVLRQDGEDYNAAVVRNLFLPAPLRNDPQAPISRPDPP